MTGIRSHFTRKGLIPVVPFQRILLGTAAIEINKVRPQLPEPKSAGKPDALQTLRESVGRYSIYINDVACAVRAGVGGYGHESHPCRRT